MNVKKAIVAVAGFIITGYGLLKILSDEGSRKYSNKWYEAASDDVLKREREMVRKQYCAAGDNYSLAVRLEKLLQRLDSELSNRAWNGRTDYGYPKHREHGWYLTNDD